MHRNLARAEEYSKPTKRGEYQYVSAVMEKDSNPFLDSEAGNAYMNFEVAELLKLWTEKIIEIDPTERERSGLGMLRDKMPEGGQEGGTEDGKWKRHIDYEIGDCLEVAETLLLPTYPREFG